MKRNCSALLVAGAFVMLTLGWASVAPSADMGTEINRACTACHSTKRICLNLGVKDRAGWKSTVSRMIQSGAQLPLNKADDAADYLAGLKSGKASFCR